MRDLTELDGLGPKTELLFNKLGIYNILDLITFYPRRYDIFKRSDMDRVMDKDRVVIDGVLEAQPTVVQLARNLKKVMFRISDSRGIYNIEAYNQVYLLKELKYGMNVIVVGKYDKYRNSIVASEIRKGRLGNVSTIESIYSATEGLNRKVIGKFVDMALSSGKLDVEDYIPSSIINKYKFPSKLWSIREMHHPSNSMNFRKAKQRLKYEEFFWYLFRIRSLKYSIDNNSDLIFSKDFDYDKILKFISNLKFELTIDQLKTIDEIKNDMVSNKQMNRLVQGDVGSGKTIVAFVAAYMNCLAGYQAALMVPTEILAEQHYYNALDLFKNTKMRIVLLTSSLSKKKRTDILKGIKNGEFDFIIGTQSLIQNDVIYKNLGLIIADEQHRFGVNQRNLLKDKGIVPDVLSMSATPIPRTYALTIYGDMDVSNIKTKPVGRKEVSTFVRKEDDILEVLSMMKREIDKGHQIYVVAPAIEDDDTGELNNVIKLKSKMELAFGKICKIGCVHGKIDNDEKTLVMNEFESGKSKILISTTVIEVGVNVPNATMIVIFKANLFGLSTLHQLRGRVGRGNAQSYCVLLTKEFSERLEIMERTTDGFEISEYDFKNRGEGDLFGVRQSGQALFKLADLKNDFDLLVRVRADVDNFILNNSELDVYKKYLNSNQLLN